jgi:hypothetical protein
MCQLSTLFPGVLGANPAEKRNTFLRLADAARRPELRRCLPLAGLLMVELWGAAYPQETPETRQRALRACAPRALAEMMRAAANAGAGRGEGVQRALLRALLAPGKVEEMSFADGAEGEAAEAAPWHA